MKDTASLWPRISALGWVRLEDYEGQLSTRVEDYEDGVITVGAPFAPNGDSVVMEKKSQFFIGWPSETGIYEVSVQLVDVQFTPIPVWVCKATSKPVVAQRRNYVRVDAELDLKLELVPRSAPITATTTDLSEGGARTLMDRWASDPGLRRFKVQIPLPQGDLIVDGQVVWWGNMQGDRRLVGLRFLDLETKQQDLLRRTVFALQLEARRRDS